ncbi:hypothetical protein ACQEU8_20875 [Streptomyces sp. CA-250714]|uniref:hypothetical protein n=1 Tax=Streptomyces sp. CA-250714 TaxID=3240060 RepID=UPI003D8A4281
MVHEVTSPHSQHDQFRRRPGRLRLISLGCVVGIALTAVVLTVLVWPRSDVVHRSQDTSTRTYSDSSRHYLGLVREQKWLGDETYHLKVGRDPGLSYGHSVDVDSTAGAEGIESTDWTTDGVRVQFRTGHGLFVPAKYFEHGR